ncbi:cytochrome b/b6 domain-containing protein [Paenarthrobacter sp. 2TAF44]|uniref:cytochrome b/b6 domain-containing protein n=1 Tax=Paenarthrobacter sp. 2TAF44 TaxID=3233018 RepID=UPI003F9AC586
MSTKSKAPPTARRRWVHITGKVALALGILLVFVLLGRWLREMSPIQDFIAAYPGESHQPEGTQPGIPAWVGWQHFLNSLLIVLIIRSGWLVRTRSKPPAYWTPKRLIWSKKSQKGLAKISLDLWFHLSLDALWVLNGAVFFVLIFATGHWMRLVPTGWDVVPNAASAALQYISLNWPVENGWNNYNSLQLLAYFTTVFVAAPLSIVTGLRMSPAWTKAPAILSRILPMEICRKVHLWVMFYLVSFIAVHVTLVLATGTLRNLNHMYAAQDGESWVGFWIFSASLAAMVAAWGLARPLFLRPVAAMTGSVTR